MQRTTLRRYPTRQRPARQEAPVPSRNLLFLPLHVLLVLPRRRLALLHGDVKALPATRAQRISRALLGDVLGSTKAEPVPGRWPVARSQRLPTCPCGILTAGQSSPVSRHRCRTGSSEPNLGTLRHHVASQD